MEKKNAAALLIGSTMIWAAVIVGCALVLKGTEYKDAVNKVTFIGVIVHIQLFNTLLLWGGEKTKSSILKPGATIIASAIIWGVVMIVASSALKGTELKNEVLRIIHYGTIAHFLLIWAPLGFIAQKAVKGKKEEVSK